MNILMFTNTFFPHVGGVARSVQGFTEEFRRRGHRVLVVAPQFDGAPEEEREVLRIPAMQHFRGSDFSVPVPIPVRLAAALKTLRPDIVHAHHPFLLGDTALRTAAGYDLPVVFTHHTLYEEYSHYVPGDSPRLKRFIVELASGYGNLCDAVIAPSESIAALLRRRGVEVPIHVIPTGVDCAFFATGDGAGARRELGIPEEAFVVGHVGRLAREKNLLFLAAAVAEFLAARPAAHFAVAGDGPEGETIRRIFAERGLTRRLHLAGVLTKGELANLYHAMDVFAFASRTETQGMVLTEALACGVPLVAIDAPGVREVVRDRRNGRLLPREDRGEFAAALAWVADLPATNRQQLKAEVARSAKEFSMTRTASRQLALYTALLETVRRRREIAASPWSTTRRRIEEEWKILRNIAQAAGDAVLSLHRGTRGGKAPKDRL